MSLRRTAVACLVLASLTVGAVACGGDDDGSDSPTTAAAPAATTTATPAGGQPNIVIKGFAFTVTAAKAGTITIRNDDSATHTVTADDGSFSVQVGGGETATIEVATPGSYAFHCNFHSSMTATLDVA